MLLRQFCLSCAVCAVASAQSPPVATLSARSHYASFILEAAKRFGLPPSWIRIVLVTESAGDKRAISGKGAMGLMQVMPATWSDLRARHRLGSDPYDPHDNIIAGSAYIRELFDRYGSPGWIAAYNAGPGRYEAWLQGRPLPLETRAYVAVVAAAIGHAGTPAAHSPPVRGSRGGRGAPLFETQRNDKPTDDRMQAEHAPTGPVVTGSEHDRSDIAPRSTGLFVPKTSEKSAP